MLPVFDPLVRVLMLDLTGPIFEVTVFAPCFFGWILTLLWNETVFAEIADILFTLTGSETSDRLSVIPISPLRWSLTVAMLYLVL